MAGEFKYTASNTTSTQTSESKLAKAFCEGRVGQVAGSNTNPHASGSDAYAAYEAGYSTVTPEGLIDNCALAIPITVPNLVGDTSAVAQGKITAANLIVGKITGTTGVVSVQLPAAAAKVQPNTVVTFTIA